MHAWPASEVPALPGQGLPLRIHDTATSSVREVVPTGPTARLYVCGITPYDATHLGHAATYNTFDLVQRVWKDAGHDVLYVQNVTDVDDPLIERAAATGQDWTALAERETALFREDMTALRMLPPAHYIGAVESIPWIVPLVQRLLASGAAYEVDGDVYFSVDADPRFGEVSGLTREQMLPVFAERGGDPERPGKKNPLDALLWLSARPGEPAWETELGRGRPGWHIECVAIALEFLGMDFDIQGGGSDLSFPHHEMGAAHAQTALGEHPYARAYVHAGMVGLDGHKMSKSRGNLVFVSALRRDGIDPAAIRLALLAHHYRSDWEWTAADLDAALTRLATWRSAVSRPDGPPAEALLAEVRAALADDLDAPAALAAVDRWAATAHAEGGEDTGAPGLVSRTVDALLGVAL
ncbi:cysteine--1-D-myo-inosityl 2-amino-2-deoxy-alpha-D-glucopyranoside ligase [Kitasatospora sp. YST-16]|uniref:cysteine--1-D-myo-inosityl 2-amino-2-deoxy-alpha-D-glucopyranoside ligase n=1 Tax=unclassified Kitasatospora TaxID=2633591 RepID=UPI0004C3A610|nr:MULTISPECIES: cysteine--1-D-myo-inosityl 2-amino-2-deoxy-alpha-D-glucopyranoside ligase [unclassified Kitasatospora]WAL75461.1 cysteine--1-D-myo-inosityl 2-amino-2-deoxy-alpha-D-glucopyranoside ligase [Kitasatospora sp. YST-16]WNW41523.1 cysteine--1-D-myo-inosityl 2-amino-2-deoxy-alpha-D-glucopyranoside ligase [Streptomyces sp. Li-HN-5-13]